MNFKKFVNMDVNLQDFTNVYNSYANTKNNFGGGYVKVKDLLKQNGGKLKVSKKSSKKGGAVADADARKNIFYDYQPSGNITNVNTFSDLTVKQQASPQISATYRGIF
jgi:hypothetical protein